MPSKMVIDREKTAAAVEAAIDTHAEETAAALAVLLAPVLGDDEAPSDVVRLQQQLGRLLAQRRDLLVRMDEAHAAELSDDLGPRRRRDEAAQQVASRVVSVRQTLAALYGPDAARALLGLEGETARDPVALARQGRRLLERLADPAFVLPEARFSGVDLDPESWIEELASPVGELETALGEVARERREAETTLSGKLLALAEFDRTYRASARVLEGLYELTGLDEYASRVRPTTRGGGTTATEPPPEEGAAEQAVPAPVDGVPGF